MSINQISTKVCIIGASQAGLLTANILQNNGISCIVVEKISRSAIYARSRVGLLDSKTVDLLQDCGLSDRFFLEAIPQNKCEFRTPEQNFAIDYAKMCRGQVRYTYPQQKLLADSIERFEQTEGKILFDTEASAIVNDNRGAKVQCQQNGKIITIECDFIAGCDGFGGISRSYIPQTTPPHHQNFKYTWLAIDLEETSPTNSVVYALHSRGFAGYLPYDKNISRYYLQVADRDTVADWSNARIHAELQVRLAEDDAKPIEGEIIAKQIIKLEHFIPSKIQHLRLFLAGNSAHVTTPIAAKEMNLAIQDADVLGKSFVSYYHYQDNLPLKNYSKNRLLEVKKIQQFSESLLHMINLQDNRDLAGKSQQRVQQFKRSQLANSELYAFDFARKYVGYMERNRTSDRLSALNEAANVLKFDPNELPPLKVG